MSGEWRAFDALVGWRGTWPLPLRRFPLHNSEVRATHEFGGDFVGDDCR